MPWSRRSAPATLALAVALAALWPWISGLGNAPYAPDSQKWMTACAYTSPNWAEWVFASVHFVGYRPTAAITYTANFAIAGFEASAYRVVDLVLLALAGAAAAALVRALRPRSSSWLGPLAVVLLVGHASVEHIAPYIARRSYSLGTGLALGGLALAVARDGRTTATRALLGGAMLGAAVLSNEAFALAVAALPFLIHATLPDEAGRTRATLVAFAPTAAFALLAVVARTIVVGGVGGYTQEAAWRGVAEIQGIAWRSLSGPLGSAGGWLLLAAAPYYAFRAWTGPGRLVRVVLAVWLLVLPPLLAYQRVWFERQAFFMAVPVALLVAVTLADTLEREPGMARLAHLLPQAMVVVTLLAGSPILRGPDAARAAHWAAWDSMLAEMESEIESCPAGSRVLLVRPNFLIHPNPPASAGHNMAAKPQLVQRVSRAPIQWLKLRLRDAEVQIVDHLWFEGDGAQIEVADDASFVLLPEGTAYFVREGALFPRTEAVAPVRESLVLEGARPATHVYLARPGGGELVALP
jgi:hypothetical protein